MIATDVTGGGGTPRGRVGHQLLSRVELHTKGILDGQTGQIEEP